MDRSAASEKKQPGSPPQFFHGNTVTSAHLLPVSFYKNSLFHIDRSVEIHSSFSLLGAASSAGILHFYNGILQRLPRLFSMRIKLHPLIKSSDHKITPRRTAFVFFILPPQMSRCCSSDAQPLNTANSNLHLFYCMRNKKDLLQEFFKLHIIDINNMPKHASYA